MRNDLPGEGIEVSMRCLFKEGSDDLVILLFEDLATNGSSIFGVVKEPYVSSLQWSWENKFHDSKSDVHLPQGNLGALNLKMLRLSDLRPPNFSIDNTDGAHALDNTQTPLQFPRQSTRTLHNV